MYAYLQLFPEEDVILGLVGKDEIKLSVVGRVLGRGNDHLQHGCCTQHGGDTHGFVCASRLELLNKWVGGRVCITRGKIGCTIKGRFVSHQLGG